MMISRDVLEKNNKLIIYGDTSITVNYNMLNELYMPIVGYGIIGAYNKLWSAKQILQASGMNVCKNILEFCNWIKIGVEDCVSILHKLCALNLIQIYVDDTSNDIIIKLHYPLSYCEFINNRVLRNLLIDAIGESQVKQLQYYYGHEIIPERFCEWNVDAKTLTFEKLNKTTSEYVSVIDWNKVNLKLLVQFNKKIEINDVCMQKIESYYRMNYLNEINLYEVIYQSCKCDNGVWATNELLIDENIGRIISEIKQTKKIELIRDAKIFDPNTEINEFDRVIQNYCCLSCTNYLIAVTKSGMLPKVSVVFKKIKTTLELKDSLINVVVDYSIYKNCGRIEPNYIYKLCQTIVNLNITDVYECVNYFKNIGTNTFVPKWGFGHNCNVDVKKQNCDKNDNGFELISFDEIGNC